MQPAGLLVKGCNRYHPAVANVINEDLLQLIRGIAVVNEGINFEVQFEAPEVQVCRPNRGHLAVNHHRLGMKEASLIGIDGHPFIGQDVSIVLCRPVHKGVVWLARDHDSDINPGMSSDPQGIQDTIIGDQVGRLDLNVILCRVN